MTFDIVLLYYDNPLLLKNWFYRLFNHSDYLKYYKFSKIIIADSGTPLEKLEESINAYNNAININKNVKINSAYLRIETEEIRKKVPPNISARPASHTYNIACLDYSKADLIYTSVIGHIYSPKYFERTLAIHLQDDRALVLPKRFDLDYEEYHETGYNDSWNNIIKNHKLIYSGGWPDLSVRRNWLQEINGWDEEYITIAPIDMDIASRLSGVLDDGTPSNRIFPNMSKYENLGLNFYQPFNIEEIISLTCNQYKNHIATDDSRRQLGYENGIQYYLKNWSKIKRNKNRISLTYKEY